MRRTRITKCLHKPFGAGIKKEVKARRRNFDRLIPLKAADHKARNAAARRLSVPVVRTAHFPCACDALVPTERRYTATLHNFALTRLPDDECTLSFDKVTRVEIRVDVTSSAAETTLPSYMIPT